MHIFFSVGEPSGDQHAAHLIQELKRRNPGMRCTGFGGPRMDQAGCQTLFPLTKLAVMGIFRVLPLLMQFIRLVGEAKRFFEKDRPDAVVLVDFPGFNWWIARKAKAAGIPVFYYLPPQLWAWASWRIRRIRKFVDHVICALPFEPQWYAERGIQVDYVGHPFFDEVAEHVLDADLMGDQKKKPGRIVGILPGSRNHEIEANWPVMLSVMEQVHARHPEARFLVASYREPQRDRCVELLRQRGCKLPIEFQVGKTPEVIELSEFCLMVSGSVSLELLARGKPACVVYSVNRLMFCVFKLLIRLKTVTLPNLMAGGRSIYPEWTPSWFVRRDIRQIAVRLHEWLESREALSRVRSDVTNLRREVLQRGATLRTADVILSKLAPTAERRNPTPDRRAA